MVSQMTDSIGSALRRTVVASAALLLALGLAVPAAQADEHGDKSAETPQFGTPEQKEEVRVRVQDYWNARIARERRVMDFYAPAELGGPTGPGDVSEFGNLTYREVEIKDIKVGSNWASVTLKVRLSLMVGNVRLPDAAEYATITEQWNLVDGTWYKKPIPPGLTPTKPRKVKGSEEDKKKQEYLDKVKELQLEVEGESTQSSSATEPQ